jgi:hypothetical protein
MMIRIKKEQESTLHGNAEVILADQLKIDMASLSANAIKALKDTSN